MDEDLEGRKLLREKRVCTSERGRDYGEKDGRNLVAEMVLNDDREEERSHQ